MNPSQPSPSPRADFIVGVDNVIFSVDIQSHRLLVLLSKRLDPPYPGRESLPGTWVRQGESLEAAAQRILAEKIRVNNLYLEQLYTFSDSPSLIEKKPEKKPDISDKLGATYPARYLSVSYFALVRYEEAELMTQSGEVTWYSIQAVPPLPFDHNRILDYGYRRLRNKLEYSPIAFDVLPEVFTLNELYHLYQTVLGEQFADYSNFRAKLLKLGFLADTGIKTTRGAGRPASLYRFDAQAFAPLKDQPLVFI
jgi:ADP-ribose pyrophosphatase YjhB (NUDIX family)